MKAPTRKVLTAVEVAAVFVGAYLAMRVAMILLAGY